MTGSGENRKKDVFDEIAAIFGSVDPPVTADEHYQHNLLQEEIGDSRQRADQRETRGRLMLQLRDTLKWSSSER